jgi:hypothetical protein
VSAEKLYTNAQELSARFGVMIPDDCSIGAGS